ncbi:hypothetical protein [Streptomyces sp. NPDC054887]
MVVSTVMDTVEHDHSGGERRRAQRRRARLALAGRARDASDLALLLDMLALGPELDGDVPPPGAGTDLAGFNDAV